MLWDRALAFRGRLQSASGHNIRGPRSLTRSFEKIDKAGTEQIQQDERSGFEEFNIDHARSHQRVASRDSSIALQADRLS